MERAVLKCLQYEGFSTPAEVSILLVDDKTIHDMNRNYRGIDRPTDVLSFSLLEGEDKGVANGELLPIGDIVISIDTAERQAIELGRELDDELETLVIHGVLHLLGYDDSTDELADIMRNREKGIANQLTDD